MLNESKSTPGSTMLTKRIICTIAVVVMIILVAAILVSANYSVGYVVSVDGNSLGVVSSVDDYNNIVEEVKSEVKNDFDTDISVSEDAEFTMTIVNKDDCSDTGEVKSHIKAAAPELIECASLSIDGIEPIYVENVDTAYKVLSDYNDNSLKKEIKDDSPLADQIQQYLDNVQDTDVANAKVSTEDPNTSLNVTFDKNCVVETAYVPTESIRSYDEAYNFVSGTVTVNDKYVTGENDTLVSIAKESNVKLKELKALNPTASAIGVNADDIILIPVEKPVLSILISSEITYEEEIPFEVTVNMVDYLYTDETEIVSEGKNGMKTVTATINTVDGAEVSREILNETINEEPTTQVENRGTKERPTASKGTYIVPYPNYVLISATWGSYKGHTGIDLAGPKGSKVYAADGGTVTEAGWNGGYGNCITITHDNGMQTLYAHLSSINVTEGQKVAQGQLIGLVGSTGNSTGPHLHFEIRVNGKPVNPQNYLKF